MSHLVLSLFPGIGLLDMAFEEEGFCVVRGPDLLLGRDIKEFHPAPGKFDGIIGGPPCQAFSQLRHIVEANGFQVAENLIPEFERCIEEAQPRWFLMENVPQAPAPRAPGYVIRDEIVRDLWVGGKTQRLRRFSFGFNENSGPTSRFQIPCSALAPIEGEPAVTCDMRRRPVAVGGSGKRKSRTSSLNRGAGAETIERMAELQGVTALLATLREHGAFTTKALKTGIGNGVPLAMGIAVAKAVRSALNCPDRDRET